MQPFPEPYELIGLFEVEPSLTDQGVPWAYNSLRFETRRGTDDVLCDIEPGYEEVRLRWSRDGVELVRLDLRWVAGLLVESGDGVERLVGTFRDPHVEPFELQLRPSVHVKWGTAVELPRARPAV